MNAPAGVHVYGFANTPCGGLRLTLAAREILCRRAGALWLEASRALIVADLHLEKGSAYAARGQMLPPYDTPETLSRLEAEVAALSPRVLVFLGDSFHDTRADGRMTGETQERLRILATGREVIWIRGNHDAALPARLPGDAVDTLTLEGLRLAHEPADPPARAEIAGHLHPCAKVAARGGSVRRRCFVTDGERMILPAFGAFAGGLNVRDSAFSRLLSRRPLAAVMGARRVHAVGWASLRGD